MKNPVFPGLEPLATAPATARAVIPSGAVLSSRPRTLAHPRPAQVTTHMQFAHPLTMKTVTSIRSILQGALLLACMAVLAAPASARARQQTAAASHADSATPALPASLRPVVYQALANDAGPVYAIGGAGCARLPHSTLKTCFDRRGAHFAAADSSLALRLATYGRSDTLNVVHDVKPTIRGNRASYAHGNLAEWWRVLPIGFEQGFTITRRPSGQGNLVLTLAARARDVGVPAIDHSSEGANPAQDTLAWGKLRYGRLAVTDAKGSIMPATLTAKGGRVLISIDDSSGVYPLTVDPLVWAEEQEITASDGASNDEFGISVAVHGTTAMVGARQATIGGNEDQGAVYVFNQSGGEWNETQKLTASDGAAFDTFGNSVAFNGTSAFVGAFAATVGANAFQGTAYVFTLSNGTWTQTQKLTSSDGQGFDYFGYSVAFNGTTAFVGADAATVGDNGAQGAVYVFSESGGTWSESQKLLASDGSTGDIFGYSIAVDGATAVIGAYANNGYQGAVYVFNESGGTWSETQKLTADDGTANNYFGYSAAVSGATLLVGAWGASPGGNDTQGAAYVFTESTGTWSQAQKLTADDGAPFDSFGHAVALEDAHALVGADGVASARGAVYAFDESGGTWTQSQKLFASDGAHNDAFGSAVTLDGTRALAGAWGWHAGSGQGAAYFFTSGPGDTIFADGFDGATP